MKLETLYNLFSVNLSLVKNALNVEFSEQSDRINDIYICPLTFMIYTREGLQKRFADHLSIEHVPPNSLGGLPLTLTSNIYNKKAGHTLDAELNKYLLDLDFSKGKGRRPTKFIINKDLGIKGFIEMGEHPIFHFVTTGLHHGARRLLNLFEKKAKFNFTFHLKRTNLPEVALLRIAYLLAFSTLGYGFFFGGTKYVNLNIQKIREQILHPNKNLLNSISILAEDFDDEFLGVNIIYEPKELRSLLVVFDLRTDYSTYRFSVPLPGPDDYGFKALTKFEEMKLSKETVELKIYTYPKKLKLNHLEDSLEYWKNWEALNGWTTI